MEVYAYAYIFPSCLGQSIAQQHFNLTLDFRYNAAQVISKSVDFLYSKCNPNIGGRRTYDYSASNTSNYVGVVSDPELGFPYADANCDPLVDKTTYGITDVIAVGNTSVKSLPVVQITSIASLLNPSWSSDGLFGLGLMHGLCMQWTIALPHRCSTIIGLLRSLPKPVASLHFSKPGSATAGTLTLGGDDVTNCDASHFSSFRQGAIRNELAVKIAALSIEGKKGRAANQSFVARLSVSTSYILVREDVLQKVATLTGAEYDFTSDSYKVNCTKPLPSVVFTVSGLKGERAVDFAIPAAHYVRQMDPTSKLCTLMFNRLEEGYEWVLGSSFLRPFCLSIDYGYCETLSAELAYTLNGLLIVFILSKTSENLRNYSKVLLFNCIADLIFATTAALIKLHAFIRNGAVSVSITGILAQRSFQANFTVSTIYLGIMYFTVANSAVPLVYRYFVLCRHHKLQADGLFLLVVIAFGVSSLVPFTMEVFVRAEGGLIASSANYTHDGNCNDAPSVPYFSMTSPQDVEPSEVHFKHFEEETFCAHPAESSSHATAIVPLILNALPLSATFAIATFRAEGLSIIMTSTTMVLAWIPVVNPLLAICCIKPYRKAAVRLLDRAKMRTISAVTPIIESVTPTT